MVIKIDSLQVKLKKVENFHCGVWDDPVYSTRFWVLILDKLEDSSQFVLDITKLPIDFAQGVRAMCSALFDPEGRQNIFVFLRTDASSAIISHEIIHAVNYLFSYHGVKLDPDNDEPQAYLVHYLHTRITDLFEQYNKLKGKRYGSRTKRKKGASR